MRPRVLVVAADRTWVAALEAVLARPERLDIAPVDVESKVHPRRDPGMRLNGPALARSARGRATHAILALDLEGSGWSGEATALEQALEDDLAASWGDRAIALVAEPELEAWLVGARASLVGIDLMRGAPDPAAWWLDTGRAIKGEKPSRPKEAIDAWLALRGVTRTSSVVRDVASRASLSVERCRSRTFHKLRRALAGWFPRS